MTDSMRLPRASTNAAAASAAASEALQQQSAEASAERQQAGTVAQAELAISQQQVLQLLQQLESHDSDQVFTRHLTPDGRLGAEGPIVMHNLR